MNEKQGTTLSTLHLDMSMSLACEAQGRLFQAGLDKDQRRWYEVHNVHAKQVIEANDTQVCSTGVALLH